MEDFDYEGAVDAGEQTFPAQEEIFPVDDVADGVPSLLECPPVHLVKYEVATRKFYVDPQVAVQLRKLEAPLYILCMAGRLRSGKSYLLNRFFGPRPDLFERGENGPGFGVSDYSDPCTRGIWLWVRRIGTKTVLLMDTEGLNSPDQSEGFDRKMLSVGILLCSTFLYNSVGIINRTQIEEIEFVNELTKTVISKTKSSSSSSSSSQGQASYEKEADLSRLFPDFIWVIRDTVLQMVDGSPNEYLERNLRSMETPAEYGGDADRSAAAMKRNCSLSLIRTLFTKRECVCLVSPTFNRDALHDLELHPENACAEFKDQVREFVAKVVADLSPKVIRGVQIDGPFFSDFLCSFVNAINTQTVVDLDGSFPAIQKRSNERLIEEVAAEYEQRMKSLLTFPMTENELLGVHRTVYTQLRESMFQSRVYMSPRDLMEENMVRVDYDYEVRNSQDDSLVDVSELKEFVDIWTYRLHERIEGVPPRSPGEYGKFRELNYQISLKKWTELLEDDWERTIDAKKHSGAYFVEENDERVADCMRMYFEDRQQLFLRYEASSMSADSMAQADALREFCETKHKEVDELLSLNKIKEESVRQKHRAEMRRQAAEAEKLKKIAERDRMLEELVHERQLHEEQLQIARVELERQHDEQIRRINLSLAEQEQLLRDSNEKKALQVKRLCRARLQKLRQEMAAARRKHLQDENQMKSSIVNLKNQIAALQARRRQAAAACQRRGCICSNEFVIRESESRPEGGEEEGEAGGKSNDVVQISKIRRGDRVLSWNRKSAESVFSEVVFVETALEFTQLFTILSLTESGDLLQLRMTENHLIFVTRDDQEKKMVPMMAKHVRPGDVIHRVVDEKLVSSVITAVSSDFGNRHVTTILTMDDTVVLANSRVLVSCYEINETVAWLDCLDLKLFYSVCPSFMDTALFKGYLGVTELSWNLLEWFVDV